MDYNVLGIIPARGGSKGVPNKNLMKVGNYSLVERALFTALGSPVLDKILLSSDSQEIIDLVNEYGDFAPFVRPQELAGDTIKSLPVMTHALEWAEKHDKKRYDYIVLLEPPCPFRLSRHIEDALKIVVENNATSVMSMVKVGDYHPIRMKKIDASGVVIPFSDEEPEGLRRQDQENVFIRNGAVYIYKREEILKGNLWGDRPFALLMDRDLYGINIDEPQDLLLAKAFYKDMRSRNHLHLIEDNIPEEN